MKQLAVEASAIMFRWHSPFKLPKPIVDLLKASGGVRWDPTASAPAEAGGRHLLLYPPPHAALSEPNKLLTGYRQLSKLAGQGCLVQVERWRSQPMESWSDDGSDFTDQTSDTRVESGQPKAADLEQPEPLTALVTLALLRKTPAILDAYLDLELASELFATRPDSDYLGRLREASDLGSLLVALREREQVYQRLQMAYEEIEQLALIEHGQQDQLLEQNRRIEMLKQEVEAVRGQSQQFEEERRRLAAETGELRRQLEERNRQLATAALEHSEHECQKSEQEQVYLADRLKLVRETDELRDQLHYKQQEIMTAQQENSRLVEELHSVEEELEHHYRDSDQGRSLLKAQEKELRRSVTLLRRITEVKQLPDVSATPAPIQLLALLEGYRHSLKRAERLLRGAGESSGGKLSR